MGIQRIHRSEDEIQEILDRLEESGLSVRAFCQAEGLAESSVHKWRKTFQESSHPLLRPVRRVPSQDFLVASDLVEIFMPTGIRVRVPAGISSDRLFDLLQVVGSCSA